MNLCIGIYKRNNKFFIFKVTHKTDITHVVNSIIDLILCFRELMNLELQNVIHDAALECIGEQSSRLKTEINKADVQKEILQKKHEQIQTFESVVVRFCALLCLFLMKLKMLILYYLCLQKCACYTLKSKVSI